MCHWVDLFLFGCCCCCCLSHHQDELRSRRCSQPHCSSSRIPTSGHTQALFCISPASRGPQEIGLIVCGLPSPRETLHCCRVTAVVFSSACSDSTHAGRHHLLYPLLTTIPLAKSRSQTVSVPSRRLNRVPPHPSITLPMWTLWRRRL